jgi:hypothetical protein
VEGRQDDWYAFLVLGHVFVPHIGGIRCGCTVGCGYLIYFGASIINAVVRKERVTDDRGREMGLGGARADLVP